MVAKLQGHVSYCTLIFSTFNLKSIYAVGTWKARAIKHKFRDNQPWDYRQKPAWTLQDLDAMVFLIAVAGLAVLGFFVWMWKNGSERYPAAKKGVVMSNPCDIDGRNDPVHNTCTSDKSSPNSQRKKLY